MVEIMQLSAVMPPIEFDVSRRSDQPAHRRPDRRVSAHYRAYRTGIGNRIVNVQPNQVPMMQKMEKTM